MPPKKKMQRAEAIAPEGKDEARIEQKPGLLTIARELRDQVYSLALIEEGYIVADSSLKRPGLLSVCRRIRREALLIWYQGNIFKVPVLDCDSDLLQKFRCHLREVKKKCENQRLSVKLSMTLRGTPDWANLLIWCKRIHDEPPLSPIDQRFARAPRRDTAVIVGATQLAKQMRGLPWEKCEEALRLLRPAFGHAHSEWLRD